MLWYILVMLVALVRCSGLLLTATAVLKLLDLRAQQDWISTAFDVGVFPAGVLLACLIGFEFILGVGLVLRPRGAALVGAPTFVAFAVFHAAAMFVPELGRCPCLGALADAMSERASHAVLLATCAAASAANIAVVLSKGANACENTRSVLPSPVS